MPCSVPCSVPEGPPDHNNILTMLSVQQQHVQAMLEDRLGERYVRLDAEWPPEGGLGIDVATPAAMNTLSALAQKTSSKVDPRQLAPFLS